MGCTTSATLQGSELAVTKSNSGSNKVEDYPSNRSSEERSSEAGEETLRESVCRASVKASPRKSELVTLSATPSQTCSTTAPPETPRTPPASLSPGGEARGEEASPGRSHGSSNRGGGGSARHGDDSNRSARRRTSAEPSGTPEKRKGAQTLVVTARRTYDSAMLKRLKTAKSTDGEPLLGTSSKAEKNDDARAGAQVVALAGGAACQQMEATRSREEAIKRGCALMDQRLECLDMSMVEIEDDGNCQFRALSQELFGTQDKHFEVRRVAAGHMKRSPEEFRVFFEGDSDWRRYMCAMVSLGTWGDELTLRAVADAFRVKIHVVTSEPENWYLQYAPKGQTPVRELFLSYLSPIHYNTLAPAPTS